MRIILPIIFLLLWNVPAFAEEVEYSQFAVTLPPGWDGEEQQGFVSNDPREYSLTFGRKDDAGDKFLAQVSIYLLPNKPGADAPGAARTLADAQGDASEPTLASNFWQFTGEPRSSIIKGMATTMVNANPDYLLIIIAHDPQNLGSRELVDSLRGISQPARQLLGR